MLRCPLVSGGSDKSHSALLLGFRQPWSHFFEHFQMLVDVHFGVLYGNGPLLVPPIRLSENAAVNHRKPVLAPEIDVDGGPVAVIANLLWIKHQSAVHARAHDIGL